ncbi:hypothetical protein IAR55_001945 [Kwoniella newhampshirensis]|uniref:CID domain-containing protein n=1 Tax=Kwoniella newhampshirensis TaxID=1651941 RepID=A0AAW0Z3H1_9TREE
MSFDPFEARLQFLQSLRKLNASQLSIQKVVSFAIKYGSRCGEDLWECVMEECGKGSLNTRINILYFLDSLVEASLTIGPIEAPYPEFVTRDLQKVVDSVVPDTREGILNLKSARQILESWKTRRVIDASVIGEVLKSLEGRRHGPDSSPKKRSHEQAFSKSEILRRMEEDRERHKRLRERIWILPIPPLFPPKPALPIPSSSPSTTSPFTPASPSRRSQPSSGTTKMPPPPPPVVPTGTGRASVSGVAQNALEVEFEQTWDGASDLDEEEFAKMREGMLSAKLDLAEITT